MASTARKHALEVRQPHPACDPEHNRSFQTTGVFSTRELSVARSVNESK